MYTERSYVTVTGCISLSDSRQRRSFRNVGRLVRLPDIGYAGKGLDRRRLGRQTGQNDIEIKQRQRAIITASISCPPGKRTQSRVIDQVVVERFVHMHCSLG